MQGRTCARARPASTASRIRCSDCSIPCFRSFRRRDCQWSFRKRSTARHGRKHRFREQVGCRGVHCRRPQTRRIGPHPHLDTVPAPGTDSSETMQRSHLVLVLCASILTMSTCTPRSDRQTQNEFRPTATVKDIMVSIIDPEADVLWNAVATIVSLTGTEERAPKTDEEWATVRRSAIQLVEATNLLRIPGRRVANPGEKSENPKIELEPETIQKLIAEDPATWSRSDQSPARCGCGRSERDQRKECARSLRRW